MVESGTKKCIILFRPFGASRIIDYSIKDNE